MPMANQTKPAKAAAGRAPRPAGPTPPPNPAPGWYVDPADTTLRRYWDGDGWTGTPIPVDADSPTGPPTPTGEAVDSEPRTITFRGRVMAVKPITVEKTQAWQRVGAEFQAWQDQPPPANEAADQRMTRTRRENRLLQRAVKVFMSVLEAEADRDWVEDELMEDRLKLEDAGQIVTLAIEAFTAAQAGQTPPAPTTGPRPKAVRR